MKRRALSKIRMGHCVSHVKEERPPPRVHNEPDWSTIKSIIIYGIAKDGTTDGLQWEVVACIDIEKHQLDGGGKRVILLNLLDAKEHGATHFVHSFYYQLSTERIKEKSGNNIAYFDTMCYLDNGGLKPTLSFEQVCVSYFEDMRLREVKKLCMYETGVTPLRHG